MSYHIAQYTGVISDLRREIQRLKSQIERQEEKGSEAGVRATQGTPSTGQVPQASLLPWAEMGFVSSRSRKGPVLAAEDREAVVGDEAGQWMTRARGWSSV